VIGRAATLVLLAAPALLAAQPQDMAFYPKPAPAPAWEAALDAGDAKAGQALYAQGAGGAVPPCGVCHGEQGEISGPGGPMPRLAGLSADYAAQALFDYKAGRRGVGSQMQGIATALDARQIGSLARYIATLPAPAIDIAAVIGGAASARALDEVGDNARALPACANCHGPQGRGASPLIPPLAGLSPDYFASRMQEWKRLNRPAAQEGAMATIAQRLSDHEITALAAYYAALK